MYQLLQYQEWRDKVRKKKPNKTVFVMKAVTVPVKRHKKRPTPPKREKKIESKASGELEQGDLFSVPGQGGTYRVVSVKAGRVYARKSGVNEPIIGFHVRNIERVMVYSQRGSSEKAAYTKSRPTLEQVDRKMYSTPTGSRVVFDAKTGLFVEEETDIDAEVEAIRQEDNAEIVRRVHRQAAIRANQAHSKHYRSPRQKAIESIV